MRNPRDRFGSDGRAIIERANRELRNFSQVRDVFRPNDLRGTGGAEEKSETRSIGGQAARGGKRFPRGFRRCVKWSDVAGRPIRPLDVSRFRARGEQDRHLTLSLPARPNNTIVLATRRAGATFHAGKTSGGSINGRGLRDVIDPFLPAPTPTLPTGSAELSAALTVSARRGWKNQVDTGRINGRR